MLRVVSDADRERDLRRLERDRRRREEGRAGYFDRSQSLDRWPLLSDMSEQPTMALPVPPPRRDGETPPAEPVRPRLAVSTAIFAAATGLSRVLGLVREVVSSYYFGASGKVNAFTVAFQLPNLVRALVADASASSAFVPVFSELLEKGERKRAWRVASTLFWLMLLGLSALTAIFILIAPWVIGAFGDPGHDRALAIGLSRVLFPIVTLLGVSGIVVGILNSYDHFTVPAISPVFWNIAIIAGLAIGVPQAHSMNTKLYVYAVSILDATYAPTAIQKAFLVYMLPQGMFSVAIATVLFPSLSRFATRGDMAGFRTTVSTGLRQIAFLLIPAAAISAVLAEPIVRLLFQRGHFTPSQTPGVAHSLAAFSAGLVFNGAMLMLNRAFFSLQSNWIPTAVALGNLFLNAVLDFAFYRFGVWGIPLATAVVNVAGTWALLVYLRRRLGRIEGSAIAGTVTRVVAASAAVAAGGRARWGRLAEALARALRRPARR